MKITSEVANYLAAQPEQVREICLDFCEESPDARSLPELVPEKMSGLMSKVRNNLGSRLIVRQLVEHAIFQRELEGARQRGVKGEWL